MSFDVLREYMSHLPEYGIPAADIAVYKEHECIFRCMTGYSDYAGTVPVSRHDLYNVYSNTKLVTVTAVMHLIEQGKLGLYDPVSKFLSAYGNLTYKVGNNIKNTATPMTIFHLLTMTSGLGYGDAPTAYKLVKDCENRATTGEIVNALAMDPLEFEPGDRWCYGRGHDVLGAVIEAVTGQRFSVYLKQNIFEPLGIQHATFDANTPYVRDHISAFYGYDAANKKARPMKNTGEFSFLQTQGYESGGAGLICSTDDYICLLNALANGGVSKDGCRILTEDSIRLIQTPRLDILQQSQYIISHYKPGYGYGLGVRTLMDQGFGAQSPVGEFGWDGMTGGYGLVDTKNRIAICYMQNIYGCTHAWHKVFPETRDMVYQILKL